jgi:hypothetical protein
MKVWCGFPRAMLRFDPLFSIPHDDLFKPNNDMSLRGIMESF